MTLSTVKNQPNQCAKAFLLELCRSSDAFARVLSSAAAATTSALFRVPADVLKHRVQAYVYPSVHTAARSILAVQGLRGLYAGFGATLLRDVSRATRQG